MSIHRAISCTCLLLLLLSPGTIQRLPSAQAQQPAPPQQQGPETTTLTGKIKEVIEKGRGRILVVTMEDGSEQSFPLTARVGFEVRSPGNLQDLQAGRFFSAQGVLSNNQLFVKELTVYSFPKPVRPPQGGVAKAEPKPGLDVNTYDVAGLIVEARQHPDYPDYHQVALKLPAQIPPIMIEKEPKIHFVSLDADDAQPETSVELEVIPLRNGKWNLVRATVKLESRPEEKTESEEKSDKDAASEGKPEPAAEDSTNKS